MNALSWDEIRAERRREIDECAEESARTLTETFGGCPQANVEIGMRSWGLALGRALKMVFRGDAPHYAKLFAGAVKEEVTR